MCQEAEIALTFQSGAVIDPKLLLVNFLRKQSTPEVWCNDRRVSK
jgi:hypothetical protein